MQIVYLVLSHQLTFWTPLYNIWHIVYFLHRIQQFIFGFSDQQINFLIFMKILKVILSKLRASNQSGYPDYKLRQVVSAYFQWWWWLYFWLFCLLFSCQGHDCACHRKVVMDFGWSRTKDVARKMKTKYKVYGVVTNCSAVWFVLIGLPRQPLPSSLCLGFMKSYSSLLQMSRQQASCATLKSSSLFFSTHFR